MTRQRGATFVAVGFLGGIAAGSLMWSRMQRNCRRRGATPTARAESSLPAHPVQRG